jgi:molybdopterin-guanine dinucleotide biosynthesis protein A
MTTDSVLGAVIAGGQSTRYGRPKALERVAGVRLVDRVIDTLHALTPTVILIANDRALAESTGLPWRSDVIAGLGALGGIHAALLWAREERRTGILAVACDMPFLSSGLLRRILDEARSSEADVVVPESGGRRGIEPLCAFYSTACVPAIEESLAAEDRRMIGFHDRVRVVRITRAETERFGSTERLFLNVNTPQERDRAEQLARGVGEGERS